MLKRPHAARGAPPHLRDTLLSYDSAGNKHELEVWIKSMPECPNYKFPIDNREIKKQMFLQYYLPTYLSL